jgi:hypothetical protein
LNKKFTRPTEQDRHLAGELGTFYYALLVLGWRQQGATGTEDSEMFRRSLGALGKLLDWKKIPRRKQSYAWQARWGNGVSEVRLSQGDWNYSPPCILATSSDS